MIEKSINISYEMSDSAILEVIGAFIREIRLRQNKTQEEVAAAAGIERMTMVRIEKEGSGTLATFVRILRSLQQFHVLNQFQVATQISPLKLAELERDKRQRARSETEKPKSNKRNTKQSDW
jgi:transcriptional regulator with XRE-family HTH domain